MAQRCLCRTMSLIDSNQVKIFIDEALAKLPHEPDEPPTLQPDAIHDLVADWQGRLQVKVSGCKSEL